MAYAVLSFGGFLGMGEKLFAVPWSALKLDTVNNRFVLDASKERLKDATGCGPAPETRKHPAFFSQLSKSGAARHLHPRTVLVAMPHEPVV